MLRGIPNPMRALRAERHGARAAGRIVIYNKLVSTVVGPPA